MILTFMIVFQSSPNSCCCFLFFFFPSEFNDDQNAKLTPEADFFSVAMVSIDMVLRITLGLSAQTKAPADSTLPAEELIAQKMALLQKLFKGNKLCGNELFELLKGMLHPKPDQRPAFGAITKVRDKNSVFFYCPQPPWFPES
jgi:hypothetical protein